MKNEKKLLFFICPIVLILIIVIIIALRPTKKESIKDAHARITEESSKMLNNDKVSEVLPIDNSNVETNQTVTKEQVDVSSEYLESAIDEMKENKAVFDFSGYKRMQDTTDYSKYESVYEIVAGEPMVTYAQKYYFEERADCDYTRLKFSFNYIDVKQELNEYHLYNADMSLEYMPVTVEPGQITYIIEDVKAGDEFQFYLDAPYLGGVSFLQQEDIVYDFSSEEDVLAYYGDWFLEEGVFE